MTQQTRALLFKEWIKFRSYGWLLLPLMACAAMDSFLTLKTIARAHGSFGLFYTLVEKQPMFFSGFLIVLVTAGALTGSLQVLPEANKKRLRLFFHTPAAPLHMIGVTLGWGAGILVALNLFCHTVLAGIMIHFHLPGEMVVPVLKTLGSWSILSLVTFFCTGAFFAAPGPVARAGTVASFLAAFALMGRMKAYGLNCHDLGLYLAALFLFVCLTCYAYFKFMAGAQNRPGVSFFRGACLLLVILSLAFFLPQLYWRGVMPSRLGQTIYFSPVKDRFLIQKEVAAPLGTQRIYTEDKGDAMTIREFAAALPFIYARDLDKWKIFPDRINGIKIPPMVASNAWTKMTFTPRNWNCPPPLLYLMFESNPSGVRLEIPKDFLRLSRDRNALEFIVPQTGRIDQDKSQEFTRALAEKGFTFPVMGMGENANPKKKYDEGFLMVDAKNILFQLKMRDGQPVCRNSGQKINGKIRGIFVNENFARQVLGTVVTDARAYAIGQKDLVPFELPMPGFNGDTGIFSLWTDPFCKTVVFWDVDEKERPKSGVAMSPDFRVKQKLQVARDPDYLHALDTAQKAASLIFPFRLTPLCPGSEFTRLHLAPAKHPAMALGANLACLCILMGIFQWRNFKLRPWDTLMVAVFGCIALAVVLAWEDKQPRHPRASKPNQSLKIKKE